MYNVGRPRHDSQKRDETLEKVTNVFMEQYTFPTDTNELPNLPTRSDKRTFCPVIGKLQVVKKFTRKKKGKRDSSDCGIYISWRVCLDCMGRFRLSVVFHEDINLKSPPHPPPKECDTPPSPPVFREGVHLKSSISHSFSRLHSFSLKCPKYPRKERVSLKE